MGTILLAYALCIKRVSSLSWIRVYVFGDGRTKLVNFRAEHVICAIFERDCHDVAVRYEWVAVMLMRCVISQPWHFADYDIADFVYNHNLSHTRSFPLISIVSLHNIL